MSFPVNSFAWIRVRLTPAILLVACCHLLAIPAFAKSKPASKPAPIRIQFTAGAISTQIRGRLNSSNEAVYVARVKAGDHMIVNIIGLGGLMTSGEISGPGGQGGGSHGGLVFNEDVTVGGDFTIKVGMNLMAESPARARSFILEVVITPAWLHS